MLSLSILSATQNASSPLARRVSADWCAGLVYLLDFNGKNIYIFSSWSVRLFLFFRPLTASEANPRAACRLVGCRPHTRRTRDAQEHAPDAPKRAQDACKK